MILEHQLWEMKIMDSSLLRFGLIPTLILQNQLDLEEGYRRVEKIIKFGKHIGYYFIPFSEYLPQWASDIFGYDSFEEALEDIYPYQIKEIKAIKDLYATRPKMPSIVVWF